MERRHSPGEVCVNSVSRVNAQPHAYLPRRRQLRWQLVLCFVALATVPLLTALGFALIQMRAQSERQIMNQLESVAELKQLQIARWLEGNALLMQSFLIDADTYAQLVDVSTSSSANGPPQSSANAALRALTDLHGEGRASHFRRFFVYDRAGKIRASSAEAEVGKVVVNQPFFANGLRAPYVQPPYYAVGDASLTMVMTQPLRDRRGQNVAVLAGEVNLAELGEIMRERTGLGESGETYLVSQENNYLLTPSRSSEYPLNRAYHSVGIDRALRGERGAGVYEDYRLPPTSVIGSYRWIPVLNTALLAEINESEAQGLFTRTATLSAVTAVIAALAAALIGLFVATRIARPITLLTQAATQIMAGALDQRAQGGQRNEIGLLATAFNNMADQLQQTLKGLEQRVAQRTADLERANADTRRALTELRESIHERTLLSATVRELSSPVLPIRDGVLVMPLIGVIDGERAALLMDALLGAIERQHARTVILDVTGVPLVDTQVAQALVQVATAARLLGAQVILVGMRPELAQTIVSLGIDLRGLVTRADLQGGVSYALQGM